MYVNQRLIKGEKWPQTATYLHEKLFCKKTLRVFMVGHGFDRPASWNWNLHAASVVGHMPSVSQGLDNLRGINEVNLLPATSGYPVALDEPMLCIAQRACLLHKLSQHNRVSPQEEKIARTVFMPYSLAVGHVMQIERTVDIWILLHAQRGLSKLIHEPFEPHFICKKEKHGAIH
jgi:hypothetical protein